MSVQHEHPEVFVIMPFGSNNEYRDGNSESEYVYANIIKPGIYGAFEGSSIKPKVRREVDKNLTGSITAEIVRALARADFVVADLTGRNPNVFLELGIRFSLRSKGTVLIAQHGTAPPFDVSDYRTIFYRVVDPEAAQHQIAEAVREIASERCESDSLVFDTFPQISVLVPGYVESHGGQGALRKSAMFWSEYWGRLEAIIKLLEGPSLNGQFAPDVVMGISNGGLIAADLVGRKLFRGTPIVSLWANRFVHPPGGSEDSFWFFDNEYNDALIESIRGKVRGRAAVVLLLDDHLGTGTTARQAASYLRARFDEGAEILFIPMFSNRPEYVNVVEDLLPHNYGEGKVFRGLDRESLLESMKTQARQFPYPKEISYGV